MSGAAVKRTRRALNSRYFVLATARDDDFWTGRRPGLSDRHQLQSGTPSGLGIHGRKMVLCLS